MTSRTLSFSIVAIALGSICLCDNANAQAEPALAPPTTMCVEPTVAVANDISRKRASSCTACDPSDATRVARQQAGVTARDAIDSICRERVTLEEAEATCRARGLRPAREGFTMLSGAPIAAEGRRAPDASLPIQSLRPSLCVNLRNVNDETETTRQPAGIQNGFCVFNGNKTTTKKVRVRATCGVACQRDDAP